MKPNFCTESGCLVAQVDNEHGAALIVVLVMLLLLSILGVTMLDSTTSELRIVGNHRNSEEAFYVAEAALSFGMTYEQVYTTLFGATTTWPAAGQGRILDPNNFSATANANNTDGHNPNYNRIQIPGTNNTADVKVDLVAEGVKLPVGTGSQEDSGLSPGSSSFKANYFAVNVIAYGPNNSQVQVESMVAKSVPQ